MGFYRLLLAFFVVTGHVGISILGYDPGVVAVVSFFLMSGYVMTGLIDRHYREPGRLGLYYLDRALRLFPQFLFYSLATIFAVERLGLRHTWLQAPPSALSDLAQLTILPLNYVFLFPDMLMPQAWSLGLEAGFYLVFPLILLGDKRLPVAAASVLVFGMAYFGRLPEEWFGYRLLPGALFIFLIGSFLRRPEPKLGGALVLSVLALALLALAASPWVWDRHVRVMEVLAGFILGLPVVWALSRVRHAGRLDELAGDLSYGVFLNHNLLLPGVAALLPHASPMVKLVCVLPVSLTAAYASYLVIEKPALQWRRRLRERPHAPMLAPGYALQPPSS